MAQLPEQVEVEIKVSHAALPTNPTRREEIQHEIDCACISLNKASVALINGNIDHHHISKHLNDAKINVAMALSTFEQTVKNAANHALDHRDEVEQ